jgi:hypothetical protein
MSHLSTRRWISVAAVAVGVLAVIGCSQDHNPTDNVLGRGAEPGNGLALAAVPERIVIDPADPNTPTDPNNGNKRYGEAVLTATATDPGGAPQADLPLTFTADAGTLASAGAAINTDTNGVATDTLRVFEDSPDTINVSVTDGTRTTTIVVTKLLAEPPVANAGADQTVECTGDGGSQITLDASKSTDPNGDITTLEWFEGFGTPEQVSLGTGAKLQLNLPVGVHTITLQVTDSTGKTATDEVVITVTDTTPPVANLDVSPSTLWPPNHKMVDIAAGLDVHDCGPVTVSLLSVTSNEPDNGTGDGDTDGDIQGADIGTDDRSFQLRAERSGHGSGRVYTVVYRIVDAGGLSTDVTKTVRVPHDQGH